MTVVLRLLRALAFVAATFVVALPLAACSDESRAVLRTATGDHAFTVEIADDDAERAKGLMFRQSLASDHGMLFDFGSEREVSFWMRNTFIPLDMIFIGADGTVKAIHENARPQDPTSIPSGAPVRFVFEIVGGGAAAIGLEPGDTFEHARVVK